MSSLAEMITGARGFLRDYPKWFEVDVGPVNVLTTRLPHPLIAASSLQVYLSTTAAPVEPATVGVTTTALTSAWTCDERNGLLKLTSADDLGKRLLVAGYYYTWFLDSDLSAHVTNVSLEHTYNRDTTIDSLTGVEAEVVQIGAVVRALWSLASELALDIDVSSPEGMAIPASQRYHQVFQMMQYWEAQYTSRAAMLNVGLNSLDVLTLRRVAYLTGRYVPLYKTREIDDRRPPQRLRPLIPSGVAETSNNDDIIDVYESISSAEEYGREGYDLGLGGWTSIGTRGN